MATAIATGFKAVAAWVAGNAVAQAVLTIAASVVLTKALTPKVSADTTGVPRESIIRSTTQPQVVIYGESVVGGVIAYANTLTSGEDKEIHMLIVVAGHEVEDITDLYFDSNELTDGGELDWSSNAVTSGDYYPDSGSDKEAVKVWKALGTSTDAAFSELTSNYGTDITSAHRGRGLAKVLLRFKLTPNSEELWEGGLPGAIRFKVKGKKVYDPRLDSTQIIDSSTSPVTYGSGSHRTADATTWAWSDNPILCAADYATTVKAPYPIAAADIDWEVAAQQADICDVLVEIPPAASPANTEKRYTCNGALSLGDTNARNINDILSSCMGRMTKVSGKWRFYVGAYQAPNVSIGEDDIIGPVALTTSMSRQDRFNKVMGTFFDPASGYQETEFLPVTISEYVTRDNSNTIEKDIELRMTNSETMAQRIAWKTLNQGDMRVTAPLNLKWSGLRLVPGLTCSLTYDHFAYSSKVFRVINWAPGGNDAPIKVLLREDSSAAWADPEVSDYSTRTTAGILVPGDGSYAGFARNTTYVADRTASDVATEIFSLNDPTLRWRTGTGQDGYEDNERFTGDIYGGTDAGTLLLDTFNRKLKTILFDSGNAVNDLDINFEARNDRDATTVTNPSIAADGTAVDHAVNTDGSVDISFEWSWSGTEADIDGFFLFYRAATSAGSPAYNIGDTPAQESMEIVRPDRRYTYLRGVAADHHYTFGIAAFRVVDPDVDASGYLVSNIMQPSLGAEDPYQPASSVAFAGDVTGTVSGDVTGTVSGDVDGTVSGTVVSGATIVDRLASAITTELFSIDSNGHLRWRTGYNLFGYESAERFLADIYGGSDGGTLLIDTINSVLSGLKYSSGNVVDTLEPDDTGATAGAGNQGEVTARNANFEAGDRFWTHQTGWSITTGNAHQGTYNAAFTGTAAGASRNDVFVQCKEGDQFQVSGWVKTTAGAGFTTAGWRVNWYEDDATTEISTTDATISAASTTYAQVSAIATAPANAEFARLEAVCTGWTTGTVYVDDGRMAPLAGATRNTGALADLDTVGTSEIDDNSVLLLSSSAGQTTQNLVNSGWTTILTVTQDVTGADSVTIQAMCPMLNDHASLADTLEFRVTKGGTLMNGSWFHDIASKEEQVITLLARDTSPGSGSVTYDVDCRPLNNAVVDCLLGFVNVTLHTGK